MLDSYALKWINQLGVPQDIVHTPEKSGNLPITELPDTTQTVTPPLHVSPDPLPLDNPIVKHLSKLYKTPVLAVRSQDSLFGVTERFHGFDSPALKWINQLGMTENTHHTPEKVHELYQLQHKVKQQREEIHVLRQFCQEKETELIKSLEKLQDSEIGCRELSATRGKVSDLQDEKVALHQQTELLEKEKGSLQKEVRALSGYKDRCEHLQDMSGELASTAKGNQMLLLNAEKLQLQLNSEKDKSFQLQTEKSSVEQTVLELQASSVILGQRKQQLEEELEQVRDRMTHLEADLSALKKSNVEDVLLDDGERMSERSDEIALLFKIKLLEEEIIQLREFLPKACERDQLEVELNRVTSDLEVMQRGREDLCQRYSETKADALRLEGQLEASKETVASLSKENSALKVKLNLHYETATHTTFSALTTAASERSAKEETSATLNEVSKERVCELKAELETAAKSNSEFQKELHHVKCELGSLQGELEISNKRFERKAEQLELETSDFKECKKTLETNLEQFEKQSSREHVLLNTIDGLRADTLGLAHTNQTLQQENQKLALMVKEYEAMQEDNTSSVLEELEESKNTEALGEILDDLECEGNILHTHIQSLNVQLQETIPRDRRGRFTPGSRRTTGHMCRRSPKFHISPKILRSHNKNKLSQCKKQLIY